MHPDNIFKSDHGEFFGHGDAFLADVGDQAGADLQVRDEIGGGRFRQSDLLLGAGESGFGLEVSGLNIIRINLEPGAREGFLISQDAGTGIGQMLGTSDRSNPAVT